MELDRQSNCYCTREMPGEQATVLARSQRVKMLFLNAIVQEKDMEFDTWSMLNWEIKGV